MSRIMKEMFLKTKELKLLEIKNSSRSITRIVSSFIF
jgi:hypothetical protein